VIARPPDRTSEPEIIIDQRSEIGVETSSQHIRHETAALFGGEDQMGGDLRIRVRHCLVPRMKRPLRGLEIVPRPVTRGSVSV